MKRSSKLGFSLIELSVVILVIGILVVGIAQGSRIMTASKLRSAQSLTQSSPVNSMEGAVLWLETTSDKAFQNSGNSYDVTDNDNIKNWNDINPTTLKFVATESTNMPVYKKNGIGTLPTLFFDAASNGSSGDYLTIPYNASLNSDTFTTFVVTQALEATGNWGVVIMTRNWNAPTRGYNIYKNNVNTNWELWNSGGSTLSGAITFNQPVILTVHRTSSTITFYQNGTLKGTSASTYIRNPDNNFTIGINNAASQFFYDGYVSEIICFNRALKASERTSVEQYLSQKYGIKLS
jgi:prepilin-type N-terminal cleavage/methylation domain-containing protein